MTASASSAKSAVKSIGLVALVILLLAVFGLIVAVENLSSEVTLPPQHEGVE